MVLEKKMLFLPLSLFFSMGILNTKQTEVEFVYFSTPLHLKSMDFTSKLKIDIFPLLIFSKITRLPFNEYGAQHRVV